jgi:hypothetical protein
MTERVVPVAELDGYVGQNISAICPFGFTNEAHHTNHCAHFVAHLLNLSFGSALCHPRDGATLRVNDIFNRCGQRGRWDDRPLPLIYSLIFATQPTNMAHGGNMMDGPNKHMGIWSDPYVYNYSTMARQVPKETVADFQARLESVYDPDGGNTVQFFYGYSLP